MSLANEEAMMLVIPAARAALSKILKKEYGMSQAEIAKRLGTTQAAVSKYLNNVYSKKIGRMKLVLERKGIVEEIARLAASGAKTSEISNSMDMLAHRRGIMAEALRIQRELDHRSH